MTELGVFPGLLLPPKFNSPLVRPSLLMFSDVGPDKVLLPVSLVFVCLGKLLHARVSWSALREVPPIGASVSGFLFLFLLFSTSWRDGNEFRFTFYADYPARNGVNYCICFCEVVKKFTFQEAHPLLRVGLLISVRTGRSPTSLGLQ